MRTTVTISDDLLDRLKREARRSRRPFKAVLNEALRLGVDRLSPPARRRAFRQRTFRMGYPPGTTLDKALQLAARLEDEEISRKLSLGK
jgi:ribbon-helix-helix CopG family protein